MADEDGGEDDAGHCYFIRVGSHVENVVVRVFVAGVPWGGGEWAGWVWDASLF